MARGSVPTALTIAGSDSGGGAGLQADLRTFAMHRVHGMSAVTCITAQNTLGVNRVDALSPESVAAQIDTVVDDIGVDGAKTGMLLNAAIIETVADRLQHWQIKQLVVDPVMVSRTGAQLIDQAAMETLRDCLLPRALITTPNAYEAQLLAGIPLKSLEDMKAAAAKILDMGPQYVVVKGGGLTEDLQGMDLWMDGSSGECTVLRTELVNTPHTHGTGCTLAAAIAANLARGLDPLTAAKEAKNYVTNALKHSLAIGSGQGPVGHFYPLLQNVGTAEMRNDRVRR
ncbi:MAG: bifunctional hydroxymethylpyrimidine kinase/phosphomethylpyrimidine kinase [Cyanobacteria bacterium P01_C01_bin.89]